MAPARTLLSVLLLAVSVGGLLLATGPARSERTPTTPDAPGSSGAVRQDGVVRGMTVSTPTWGWEWGTDAMDSTLRELASLGVNWVAIHPYAGIGEDGSVSARPMDPAQPPDWLARPIREAHALGLKVMIKPHIAYWGTRWSWRGDIALGPAQAERFWRDYPLWIEALAEASAGADAFVVGTELDQLLEEDRWRALIREVRARTTAPLTYAANWTDYGRVPFWDALDVIGVQAYFPLVQGDGLPSEAALDAGWDRVMEPLRALSQRVGRPVVFTELGYNRSSRAASEPWQYATGGAGAEQVQGACLRAALRVIDREPALLGAFLWKWFPGPRAPRDFDASAPHVREIVAETWGRAPIPPG